MLDKHPSKPHNKKIADIFFKAGFIEAWGRGILRIINDFRKVGLPDPLLEETMGGIMVTIYRGKDVVKDVVKDKDKEVINLIIQDNTITANKIGEIMKISSRTAQRILENLQNQKRIERIGGRKEGHWVIIEL